jgi:hypothetical protein
MISDKLTDIIFKSLYNNLSCVEIIDYQDEIWFINRETKEWFFIYTIHNGELWWRYSFFTPFFSIFSLNPSQFTSIISSWVEEVLNHKVYTTKKEINDFFSGVEAVLNHKVSTTYSSRKGRELEVGEVLNHKVNTTNSTAFGKWRMVEEVLNHKVTKTKLLSSPMVQSVEEVLNHKVGKTKCIHIDLNSEVSEVLKNNKL